MKTILVKISYFGKPFYGFARQPETITVQGNIEDALHTIFGRKVETVVAGRTDSGVHANGNYITFNITDDEFDNKKFTEHKLQESLDALTNEDIHVREVKIIDKEFSARFDAKARKYSYFICNQSSPSVVMRDTSWHIRHKLDIEKMKTAAEFLIGEHDFKSFCVAKSSEKLGSTCRYVSKIIIENNFIFGDNIIEVHVEGNAFLHSMVRTIVGSLVMVGLGQRDPQWMRDVLQAKDRTAAGQTAPACGLILMDVDYPLW